MVLAHAAGILNRLSTGGIGTVVLSTVLRQKHLTFDLPFTV